MTQDTDGALSNHRSLRLLHFVDALISDVSPNVKDGTATLKLSVGNVDDMALADLWNLARSGKLQVALLPSQAMLGATDANAEIQQAFQEVLHCISLSPQDLQRCWKRVSHEGMHESSKDAGGHSWPQIPRCDEEHGISGAKCQLYPGHTEDHAALDAKDMRFSWARLPAMGQESSAARNPKTPDVDCNSRDPENQSGYCRSRLGHDGQHVYRPLCGIVPDGEVVTAGANFCSKKPDHAGDHRLSKTPAALAARG